MTRDGPPATISGGIWCNGEFSMLIICNFAHIANSIGKFARFGLSFKYKCSRLSSWPVEMQRVIIEIGSWAGRTIDRTYRFLPVWPWGYFRRHWATSSWTTSRLCAAIAPIDLMQLWDEWVLEAIRFPMAVFPICFLPDPTDVVFANYRYEPAFSGIQTKKLLISVNNFFFIAVKSTLRALLLKIKTSKFWSLWMSSGREMSWFVPKLSSTMFVHVPMSASEHSEKKRWNLSRITWNTNPGAATLTGYLSCSGKIGIWQMKICCTGSCRSGCVPCWSTRKVGNGVE